MTLKEILTQLEALGTEKVRKQNRKRGAGENQYGVMMGDIRKLAKKIGADHQFGLFLWETGNIDARHLAILLMDPKALSAAEMDAMVRSVTFVNVADWLNSYIVKLHPEKESLREEWMISSAPMAARAGWNLTAQKVVRNPDSLDLEGLLDRLEKEMPQAAPETQWTMNFCLAYIGIHIPELRERALSLGEKMGIYRDYPVSKGCTSPFAPIWINEMVSRQKK